MNIKIFLANPPPGAVSWSPIVSEKMNGDYWSHSFWQIPLNQVLDVDLDHSTAHFVTLLHKSNGDWFARQDIYPDFTISGGIYAYEWYSNKLIKTDHIPPELVKQNRYWLTVAHGTTEEELGEQLDPYEAADRWRFVIKTNMPSTILAGFYWGMYPFWMTFKHAVASAGGTVEKMEVVGSEFRIHVHASPTPFAALIPLIIALSATIGAVVIGMIVRDILVQKELTEQAYYAYQSAETYEDVIEYVTSPSFWVCQDCGYTSYTQIEVCPLCGSVNIKREGGLGITDPAALELFIDAFPQSKPEEERWYEKYIRWALIGGAFIAGAVLIVPQIIKAIRKK